MSMALLGCAVCVALIAWIIGGYPLLLSLEARLNCRRVDSGPIQPSVTAIIPVHNGGQFLAAKLDSVLASDYPAHLLEVLVLSDGATDNTDSVAESYVSTGRVRFFKLPRAGKAAALSAAFPHADREILLLTDVRQILDRDCVKRLVCRFNDASVGAVSGNLKIRSGENSGETNVGLYWRYESCIRRNLSAVDSVLGATGPIYAIRKAFACTLPEACILDDMWLPLQPVLAGKRAVLAEDSIAWDYPTSLHTEFRRKVRTQAGLYQLLWLEPRLWKPWSNRLWTSFFFLKLGRLFLPHLLIVLLILSFWLPSPFKMLFLSAQVFFYLLASADRFIPDGVPAKRLSGPVAAFVVLLAAAFCAQSVFFTDPAKLWKTTQVRVKAASN